MATSKFETFQQEGVWRAEWTALLNAETGDATKLPKWGNKSVHISGVPGVTGVVAIQGSNDGVAWAVLSSGLSTQGDLTALAVPAAPGATIRAVYENTEWIRPVVSAGDGTTTVKVVIIAT